MHDDLRRQHARQSFTPQGLRTAAGNRCIRIGRRSDCWCWVLRDCSLHWWDLTASEWITPGRFWHILSESTILDSHAIDIVKRLFACLRREASAIKVWHLTSIQYLLHIACNKLTSKSSIQDSLARRVHLYCFACDIWHHVTLPK